MNISKTPLISIITVSYNAAETIEQTIFSVLDQNYEDYEYIIVDGGSTDGTVDIIKKYQDKITLWVSEPDKGIYDAMNKGIRLAKGEWMNFMNSGDCYYSNETLIQVFKNCLGDLNIIYGGTFLSYDKNTPAKYLEPKKFESIKYSIPFCHQSVFVKTKLLNEVGFDLEYKYSADYDFFLKIYKQKKYFYKMVSFPISIYDMNGVSSGDAALKDNYMIVKKEYTCSYISLYHFYVLSKFRFTSFLKSILPEIVIELLKKNRTEQARVL